MIDYKEKYKQFINDWIENSQDISSKYPECNDFEKCVLLLRTKNLSYGDIQKKLGMPPKKSIRNVLNKWAPELIDNSIKKEAKIFENWNSEIYSLLMKYKQIKCTIEDELEYTFFIRDFIIICSDEDGYETPFLMLDERTQHQFYNAIKQIVNETHS